MDTPPVADRNDNTSTAAAASAAGSGVVGGVAGTDAGLTAATGGLSTVTELPPAGVTPVVVTATTLSTADSQPHEQAEQPSASAAEQVRGRFSQYFSRDSVLK